MKLVFSPLNYLSTVKLTLFGLIALAALCFFNAFWHIHDLTPVGQ